jgi:hypothetical protein
LALLFVPQFGHFSTVAALYPDFAARLAKRAAPRPVAEALRFAAPLAMFDIRPMGT